MPRLTPTGTTPADALRETRRVRFDGADRDWPVYQRERLDVGARIAGPAVLEQLDCTTVICPGQAAWVDEWGNLIVT
jgi:N-methylhydantoinase A